MSEFRPNTAYYGGYAYIKTDRVCSPHLYKIVNIVDSNTYCDVPICVDSEPYTHKGIEPVLNVIHCGIDETKVVRVAVKDCDKIIPPPEDKKAKWEKQGNKRLCSACWYYYFGTKEFNYCPNCGADMRGENNEAR